MDLERYAADHSLKTAAVDESQPPSSDELASDKSIIRNAVSAADVERAADGGLTWANARTGSSGMITALAETQGPGGQLCRRFTTTRESFDGVALYRGDVCLDKTTDIWWMQAFESL